MSCIIQKPDGNTREVESEQFLNEAELEGVIEKFPNLLRAKSDRPLMSIDTHVQLSGVGIIDLFLADEEGQPIVVEVKLGRNGESRREIVAQIFDYVSGLTLLTSDEIDELVDEKLSDAFDTDDQETVDRRWKYFGRQLRDGRTRFVLAVDDTPESLDRIMEFLCRHTNLDVRLVEIRKYKAGNGEIVFAPEIKVIRSENQMAAATMEADFAPLAAPEVSDFFGFLKGQLAGLNVRLPRGYGILSLGAGCQARFDLLKKSAPRVAFRATQKPPDLVDAAIRKVLGDPPDLVVAGTKLHRQLNPKSIEFAATLDVPKEGGLASEKFRTMTVELLRAVATAFRPVVQELRSR
jgi:hypothetical protein